MERKVTVLIVEDNKVTMEGYFYIIEKYRRENYIISALRATNYNEALQVLKQYPVDFVITEISLHSTEKNNSFEGEQFLKKIRKLSLGIKVIIATRTNDRYKIYRLLIKCNPNGFILKKELEPNMVLKSITTILNDQYFYSNSIVELMKEQLQISKDVDDIDRSILYFISKGIKTKDLNSIVPLSLAGIEKRKRKLRRIFKVLPKDEKTLIEKALIHGII